MKPSSRYHGLCAAPNEATTNGIESYEYSNNSNKNVTNKYNAYKKKKKSANPTPSSQYNTLLFT